MSAPLQRHSAPSEREVYQPTGVCWLCALTAIATMAVCVGCSQPAPEPAPPQRVRLTSGIPGAGFHPLGASLAAAYERLLPTIDVVLYDSSGTVRTLTSLQDGQADLGFALADVAYVAFIGGLQEKQRPFDHLRGIAVLELTSVHLVVREGAPIRSVSDLRGRQVGIGPSGSGTTLTSAIVLRAHGIEPDEVSLKELPWNEAARRLLDRTLDAAFVNAAYPAESVTQATRGGATLLELEGPAMEQLRSGYPFFRPTFIPANSYPGQTHPIRTVGVNNLLVCRAELQEDLVYKLTATLFEVLPGLSSQHLSVQLDLEQAAAAPIPLHEGAARYYREQELTR